MHLSCIKISIISKRTKMNFHVSIITSEYNRVRPKRLLSRWYIWRKPCTYLALTLTPSPNNRNKIWHDPHHLGVPIGESIMIFKPIVRSAQTVHLSCVKISTISKWTETSFHLSLVTKENSQVRLKLFLRLAQTVHLSCTDNNTISKQTETRFGMTHIT
jgi:hypothetical protein